MKSMQLRTESDKQGEPVGLYTVCSANPQVWKAALRLAAKGDERRWVEVGSHQVDQFGGYPGMTPADFRDRLYQLATEPILLLSQHLLRQ